MLATIVDSKSRVVYLCPITPVLITIVLPPLPSLGASKHRSASAPIFSASSIPPLPVTALAHPELIMIDRIPVLFLLFNIFRLTVTGAAWNLFFVNTAAAAHGVSEARNARSGVLLFVGLTPTCVPETKNPFG